MGVIEKRLGDYLADLDELLRAHNKKDALALAIEVVQKFQNEFEAHFMLGNIFMQIGDYKNAAMAYINSAKLSPNTSKIHNNLAVAFKRLGDNHKSLEAYKNALKLTPNNPMLNSNIGNLLRSMDDIGGAKRHLEKAILLDPSYVDAYGNLGALYKELKDYKKAEAYYRQALQIQPEHINANFDMALIDLTNGNYRDGWRRYEYRLKMPELIIKTGNYTTPKWRGEHLEGKAIMLQGEQGYGDNIMFARYVKKFVDMGAKVLLRTRPELVELFQTLQGVSAVYSEHDDIVEHDFYLPIMSSAFMFGTMIGDVSNDTPYLFSKEHFLLDINSEKLNVGIVWSSSKTNKDFKNKYLGLEALRCIFELENINFYSLQVGDDVKDIEALGLSDKILDLSARLDDFSKTASAIEALDLVITMDTAVAHLCGAMNKTAWVLLPKPADWRWMQVGDSTPWYPSLKLFRQHVSGDWSATIKDLKEELSFLQNRFH